MTDPIPKFHDDSDAERKRQQFILEQELNEFSKTILEDDGVLAVIAAKMGNDKDLPDFVVTPNKKDGMLSLQVQRSTSTTSEEGSLRLARFDHIQVGELIPLENGGVHLMVTKGFAELVLGRTISPEDLSNRDEIAKIETAAMAIMEADKTFAKNCRERGLHLGIDTFGEPKLKDDIENTFMPETDSPNA